MIQHKWSCGNDTSGLPFLLLCVHPCDKIKFCIKIEILHLFLLVAWVAPLAITEDKCVHPLKDEGFIKKRNFHELKPIWVKNMLKHQPLRRGWFARIVLSLKTPTNFQKFSQCLLLQNALTGTLGSPNHISYHLVQSTIQININPAKSFLIVDQLCAVHRYEGYWYCLLLFPFILLDGPCKCTKVIGAFKIVKDPG